MKWIKRFFRKANKSIEKAIEAPITPFTDEEVEVPELIKDVKPDGRIVTERHIEVIGPDAATDPKFRNCQPINCEECKHLGKKCKSCFVENPNKSLKFEVLNYD
jgi:hypothetical protein